MDRVEYLNEKLNEPIVCYHNFISSYYKNQNVIHVFCEGEADFSYYCEVIDHRCPGREIQKWRAKGKNNVIKTWKYIDWNRFQKNRVLFFVDRDLSYWVGEPQYYDTNVYITDGYSFENDAVSPHMFVKLLEDLYRFTNCSLDEKKRIQDLFREKWDEFVEGSYDLMGCILYKYQSKYEHPAKDLKFRKCLDFDADILWKQTIDGLSYLEYFKQQLKIDEENLADILDQYKSRFIDENEHYSIRGKWCIEFMIGLMDYVLKNANYFALLNSGFQSVSRTALKPFRRSPLPGGPDPAPDRVP